MVVFQRESNTQYFQSINFHGNDNSDAGDPSASAFSNIIGMSTLFEGVHTFFSDSPTTPPLCYVNQKCELVRPYDKCAVTAESAEIQTARSVFKNH